MTPLEMLLANLPDLREAYRDNPGHHTATERFNAVTGASLKVNTMKSVGPAILGTMARLDSECQTLREELDTVRQERDRSATQVRHMRAQLDTQVSNRTEGLDTVVQPGLDTDVSNPPKSWRGWTVQTDRRGYVRLFKKIAGKVSSVYVGRQWSEDLALAKLKAAGYASEGETGRPEGPAAARAVEPMG